jgi:hypothetical protein
MKIPEDSNDRHTSMSRAQSDEQPVIALTDRERRALAKLDEAIQAIFELSTVSEKVFFREVQPAAAAIQQAIVGPALTRSEVKARLSRAARAEVWDS